MIKQFDIIYIDLSPTKGREKEKERPCLVVNNDTMIQASNFVWVIPITHRDAKYPSDIEVKTKRGKVKGILDTVQLKSLDLNARKHNKKDELQDNLKRDVLEAIQSQMNPFGV